jgi:hypothetical protein
VCEITKKTGFFKIKGLSGVSDVHMTTPHLISSFASSSIVFVMALTRIQEQSRAKAVKAPRKAPVGTGNSICFWIALTIAGSTDPPPPRRPRQEVLGRRAPENQKVQHSARIRKCMSYETFVRKKKQARNRYHHIPAPPPRQPGDPRRVPARRTNAAGLITIYFGDYSSCSP